MADPTLQDLLDMLQSGNPASGPMSSLAAAPAAAASVPAAPAATPGGTSPTGAAMAGGFPTAANGGSALAELLGPLFGINQGTDSTLGGDAGAAVGGIAGSLLGPLGSLGGTALGDLLGSLLGGWIGGGVPTEAKTQGIAGALDSSGNPLDAMIGQFVGKEANAGNPLSSPGSDEATRRFASMVEALTGQQAPGVTAAGFNNNPTWSNPPMGAAAQKLQLPAGYQFVNDPSKMADVYKDVSGATGLNASTAYSGAGAQAEWQRVIRELIQQGALTKYKGPMGAAGGNNTAAGAIPNIGLPHPLAQNQPQMTPSPYPA